MIDTPRKLPSDSRSLSRETIVSARPSMAAAMIMSSFGSRTTPASGVVLRSTSADIWLKLRQKI